MGTKSILVGLVLLGILGVSQLCSAGSVGSAQYENTIHNDHHDALKCFSCISIQNHPNMSAEGCAKKSPPTTYLTKECFGFNSPQALSAIRHVSAMSNKLGRDIDPLNVHCVHIRGKSDHGGDITVRGCISLPAEEVYPTKTCMSGEDFFFVPLGFVKGVEYCYCKGHGCNGATTLPLTLGTSLFIPVIAVVNKFIQIL